jgi:hypothetical protein
MTIQLTTPVAVGQLDQADYTHVRITEINKQLLNNRVVLVCRYGGYANGEWWSAKVREPVVVTVVDSPAWGTPPVGLGGAQQQQQGGEHVEPVVPETVTYIPARTDFSDAMAAPVNQGETLADAEERCFHQWLLDNGYFDGTLV